MRDRKEIRNQDSWKIINKKLTDPNGLIFISKPFDQAQQLAGNLNGYFNVAINKKDVDIGLILYEVKSNGETFKLTRYISRASYASDMSKRELLVPNHKTMIPIINSTMTAKIIEKGSRLAVVLNVNKNSGAEVNMGSGKRVSDETINDADSALKLKWFSDSELRIPLSPWHPSGT